MTHSLLTAGYNLPGSQASLPNLRPTLTPPVLGLWGLDGTGFYFLIVFHGIFSIFLLFILFIFIYFYLFYLFYFRHRLFKKPLPPSRGHAEARLLVNNSQAFSELTWQVEKPPMGSCLLIRPGDPLMWPLCPLTEARASWPGKGGRVSGSLGHSARGQRLTGLGITHHSKTHSHRPYGERLAPFPKEKF